VVIRTIYLIFIISDLLFPVWLIALMFLFIRNGLSSWKAWGIASTFCVTQTYLVAKFVGGNLGAYFFILLANIPSFLIGEPRGKYSTLTQPSLWLWIMPPLLIIVIPMLILYLTQKYKAEHNSFIH
jgi:hypothetical protein